MKKLLIILLAFSVASCQTDDILDNEITENSLTAPKVNGSRLEFSSREHLVHFINESKKQDINELKSKIRNFESCGFRSLLPTFTSEDVARVEAYKRRKGLQFGGKGADTMDADEDEIIADPNFALVINDDRELIVGNDLYKFTEYAVFFTELGNEAEIKTYLQAIERCELSLTASGVQYVGNKVYAFIPQPVDDICDYEIDNGNDEADMIGSTSQSLTREQYIAQMKTCEYQENLFDKLFGPSEKCIAKFESDRRIKTRAWNQNFLIYSSVGIRTKTQKRTLGIWWASDSDEIELDMKLLSIDTMALICQGFLNKFGQIRLGKTTSIHTKTISSISGE